MNLYEHTIIARQDTSPSELKQLTDKYSEIVKKMVDLVNVELDIFGKYIYKYSI